MLWKQKSRVQWLKEGENNTKFFHRSAMDYRRTNNIILLNDEHGTSFESHKDISNLLVNHFDLISKEPVVGREEALREVVVCIRRILTKDHTRMLDCPISKAKVEEVVQNMPNGKLTQPDSFAIVFFKACWDTVQNDIWEVVEDS